MRPSSRGASFTPARTSVDTADLLRQAVREKKQVVATYDGYERELCPHVVGWKNGVLQCLAYQFAGYSSKGRVTPESPANWRCLTVAKLGDVQLRDGEWHTSANHSRPSTCVDQIDVEVSY